MKNREIIIYLEFPVLAKTLMVNVSLDSTFEEILKLLEGYVTQDQQEYAFNANTLVYEKKNHVLCDRNMSLRTMHVSSHMWFLVY